MNLVCHVGSHDRCPAGTGGRTTRSRHTVRHVGPCRVQNQNQNQTVLTDVFGSSSRGIHSSNGDLPGHPLDCGCDHCAWERDRGHLFGALTDAGNRPLMDGGYRREIGGGR